MTGNIKETKEYYDGIAHIIYRETWDKDNHHLGIFDGNLSFSEASKKANENILNKLDLDKSYIVLDLGSGFGGLPRFIASMTGCRVVGLNLAQKENIYAKEKNIQERLNHLIDIVNGNFNDIPFKNESFDRVVSQDAMLHSYDKKRLVKECNRVLKNKGKFVFSDILNTGLDSFEEKIANKRINAPFLGTFEIYKEYLVDSGFKIDEIVDLGSINVYKTYKTVCENLIKKRVFLENKKGVPPEIIEKTLDGLKFWVNKSKEGKIGWGLFVSTKE